MPDKARLRTFFSGRGTRSFKIGVSVPTDASPLEIPWTLAPLEFRTLSTGKRASGSATGARSSRIATDLPIDSGDDFGHQRL
jgi:hypothetical protein